MTDDLEQVTKPMKPLATVPATDAADPINTGIVDGFDLADDTPSVTDFTMWIEVKPDGSLAILQLVIERLPKTDTVVQIRVSV
jgi:hypothetical protein